MIKEPLHLVVYALIQLRGYNHFVQIAKTTVSSEFEFRDVKGVVDFHGLW